MSSSYLTKEKEEKEEKEKDNEEKENIRYYENESQPSNETRTTDRKQKEKETLVNFVKGPTNNRNNLNNNNSKSFSSSSVSNSSYGSNSPPRISVFERLATASTLASQAKRKSSTGILKRNNSSSSYTSSNPINSIKYRSEPFSSSPSSSSSSLPLSSFISAGVNSSHSVQNIKMSPTASSTAYATMPTNTSITTTINTGSPSISPPLSTNSLNQSDLYQHHPQQQRPYQYYHQNGSELNYGKSIQKLKSTSTSQLAGKVVTRAFRPAGSPSRPLSAYSTPSSFTNYPSIKSSYSNGSSSRENDTTSSTMDRSRRIVKAEITRITESPSGTVDTTRLKEEFIVQKEQV